MGSIHDCCLSHVEIAAELVHELDADGKQRRVVKLTDYAAVNQLQSLLCAA